MLLVPPCCRRLIGDRGRGWKGRLLRPSLDMSACHVAVAFRPISDWGPALQFGMHWLYMPVRERAVLCDHLALSWKRGLVGRHVVLPEVNVICLTIQEFPKV